MWRMYDLSLVIYVHMCLYMVSLFCLCIGNYCLHLRVCRLLLLSLSISMIFCGVKLWTVIIQCKLHVQCHWSTVRFSLEDHFKMFWRGTQFFGSLLSNGSFVNITVEKRFLDIIINYPSKRS